MAGWVGGEFEKAGKAGWVGGHQPQIGRVGKHRKYFNCQMGITFFPERPLGQGSPLVFQRSVRIGVVRRGMSLRVVSSFFFDN